MRCYVCLENCSSLSPCECSIPLHYSCLLSLHLHGNYHCSVCREKLRSSDWVLFVFLLVFRMTTGW